MIKLKAPLNYKGNIVPAGTVLSNLPKDFEGKLLKAGAATLVETKDEQKETLIKQAEKKTKEILEQTSKNAKKEADKK